MRIGEAKHRLNQIGRYLEDSLITLSQGPLSGIEETLEKCNGLLKERLNLHKRILDTEATTDVGGESIREVTDALSLLDTKISLLEKLSVRGDLGASQCVPLFKQLETYRSTRDTLRLSLEKCLWEFELIE
jgi:hypothetical protein